MSQHPGTQPESSQSRSQSQSQSQPQPQPQLHPQLHPHPHSSHYPQYPYQYQYAQYAPTYAHQGYYAYYPQAYPPKLPLPAPSQPPPPPAPTPTPAPAPTAPVRAPRKSQTLKGTFTKELRTMMYAFGDSKEPANDTVEVMEEILMEYLLDVSHTAVAPTRRTRIQIEDLRRALGRHADSKKLARLEELLFMQDDMRRARKLFSTEEKDLEDQANPEP